MRGSVRGGLLACVGLSALAHTALVGYLTASGPAGAPPRPAAGALQVRVAALPAPAVAERQEPIDSAAPTPSTVQPAGPHDAAGSQQGQASPSRPAAAGTAGVFDEHEYIPRPRLSVPPVPQQPVLLAWPSENAPPAGRYTAVLSLFIDEQGFVQRVRVDDDRLPPALREQATAAFTGVRYSPGQLQGRDVKSRIRVEVSFEAEAHMLRRGTGS